MKETPRAFAKRTGNAYAPPARLTALARPLRASQSCPTLFRYPGPLGIRDALVGVRARLSPPDARVAWLAESPLGTRAGGARRFGVVAVLEPLRLHPCRSARPGAWLGIETGILPAGSVVWIPAGPAAEALAWDRLRDAEQVRRRLGERYASWRDRALDRVCAYVEELSSLERAGVPPPPVPWYRVVPGERRRLLAAAGVEPRWTRR